MAVIYDFNSGRKQTRNQELLAEINALLSARTPEDRREAEIRGVEEGMQGLQRRLDALREGTAYGQMLEDSTNRAGYMGEKAHEGPKR